MLQRLGVRRHRSRPFQQVAFPERLDHQVGDAGRKGTLVVVNVLGSRDRDDGDGAIGTGEPAQRLDGQDAVHVRQSHVDHHGIEPAQLGHPKRFQPAGHRLDLETRARQHQGGHHPAGFAGVGQQDALLQGVSKSAGRRPPGLSATGSARVEPERAALARLAVNGEGSSQLIGQPAGDGETQTASIMQPVQRRGPLEECLEQAGMELRIDPDPRIADRQREACGSAAVADILIQEGGIGTERVGTGGERQFHRAGLREFDGVFQQGAQDLADMAGGNR